MRWLSFFFFFSACFPAPFDSTGYPCLAAAACGPEMSCFFETTDAGTGRCVRGLIAVLDAGLDSGSPRDGGPSDDGGPPFSVNLLPNGSFEQLAPDGGVIGWLPVAGTVRPMNEGYPADAGTRAGRVEQLPTSPSNVEIRYRIPPRIRPTQLYCARVAVRAVESPVRLRLRFIEYASNGQTLVSSAIEVDGGVLNLDLKPDAGWQWLTTAEAYPIQLDFAYLIDLSVVALTRPDGGFLIDEAWVARSDVSRCTFPP